MTVPRRLRVIAATTPAPPDAVAEPSALLPLVMLENVYKVLWAAIVAFPPVVRR